MTLAFRRTPEQGADELDDPHESPWWPLLDVGEVAEQQVGEILLVAQWSRAGDGTPSGI